jgi:hypothetical protein
LLPLAWHEPLRLLLGRSWQRSEQHKGGRHGGHACGCSSGRDGKEAHM